MLVVRASTLRQALAALLLIALTLSGFARAVASVPVTAVQTIAGVTVRICHTDQDGPAAPDPSGRHDCCDACALGAPAALPGAAPFTTPAAVEHVATHAAALVWAPTIARIPSPRLSQGPPAA